VSLPNKIMAWIFGDEQYRVRVTRPDGGTMFLIDSDDERGIPWQGTRSQADEICRGRQEVSGYQYAVERVT
jgi:hypothetical protein